MRAHYSIEWLQPDYADAIAALEREVHSSNHRAGVDVIRAQLEVTAADGRNLSLGMYRSGRLVGFLLVFLARNRREICEFFDAPLPDGLDPEESNIYIADYVVHPRHRQFASLLATRLQQIVLGRDDLRFRALDAFSTEEYARFWTSRRNFFVRLGWTLTGKHAFQDRKLDTKMYWLTFAPFHDAAKRTTLKPASVLKKTRSSGSQTGELTVGIIDTPLDWATLEPYWDDLVHRIPRATPQQRFRYLQNWWSHAGAMGTLCIIVALRGELPVAIAPMEIARVPRFGQQWRCLRFITGAPEVEGLSLLAAPEDDEAVAAIADYIAAATDLCDTIVPGPEPADGIFLRTLERRLRQAGWIVAIRPATTLPSVSNIVSWQNYIEGLPTDLRRHVESSEMLLTESGGTRFESIATPDALEASLERFAVIEAAAGQHPTCGVSLTTEHYALYLALARRFGEAVGLRFGFLAVGQQDIAAILGLTGDGCFIPLHVVQAEAFRNHDAALVVTFRQFEQVSGLGTVEKIIMTARNLPKRLALATELLPRSALYADHRSVSGAVAHGLYSIVKPRLKRLLYPTSTE